MRRGIAHLDGASLACLKKVIQDLETVPTTLAAKVEAIDSEQTNSDIQLSQVEIEYVLDLLPAPGPTQDPGSNTLRSVLTALLYRDPS